MPNCTGCKLTTNMSYDVATFQGPVTNITPNGSRVLLYSHVVQGVGQNELSGITGFPLGWANIYLDGPQDGSCVSVTGQLTLPVTTSGQFITGSSGISYNGSTEYCTGSTQGCKIDRLYFEFSGNPNVYKAAPQGATLVFSHTNGYLNNAYVSPYTKYHTPISGLTISSPNITSGNLTEDSLMINCGGAIRSSLFFQAYVPDVFGSLTARYYYFISCTNCQTGIGGA